MTMTDALTWSCHLIESEREMLSSTSHLPLQTRNDDLCIPPNENRLVKNGINETIFHSIDGYNRMPR
jgi:hypothetical protein